MSSMGRHDERLAELLADQALEGLTTEQELELESLFAANGVEADFSMESTAAALQLGLMQREDLQTMPADAQERLRRAGQEWAAATSPVLKLSNQENQPIPAAARRASHVLWTAGPWIAAAACLLLAVIAWWPSSNPDIVAIVNASPVKMAAEWKDWDHPEISGVRGKVVWCDNLQMGYMRFAGLPRNDPSLHQYQLWIIDERGMEQRISGGVFNVESDGEVIVPIDAGIEVHHAQAFAVTIEPPGGTWVSDMKRRVAIASK